MYQLNLPEQTVAAALTSLSEQTDIQVLFPYDIATQHRIEPLVGSYQLQHALERLLHNTGLHGGLTDSGVITISRIGSNVEINQNGKGKRMNTNKRKNLLATFVALFAAGATTQGAMAQTESATAQSRIDEIIVTAQKRSASIQDVPIAITAFSGEQLANAGIDEAADLELVTPGLRFSTNTFIGSVSIRGVGSPFNQGGGFDPSTAVYIDGVYQSRFEGSQISLMDLERLEVLKGPQGTLYGRNAVGGAINYISQGPASEFGGKLKVQVGNYSQRKFQGQVDIPLIKDELLFRAALMNETRDGYTKNLLLSSDEIDAADQLVGRFTLQYMPAESLDITLHAGFLDREGANTPGIKHIDIDPNGPNAGAQIIDDPRKVLANQPHNSPSDREYYDATVKWDMGTLQLTSVTAYVESSAGPLQRDVDATEFLVLHDGLPGRRNGFFIETDSFSQELILSSSGDGELEWLLGAFYFQEDSFTRGGSDLTAFGIPFNPTETNNAVEGYATFGHASYDLSDKLRVSAGLRYSYEEKEEDSNRAIGVLGKDDWSSWTPKISFDYSIKEDVMLYFSASRGFKSGALTRVGTEYNSLEPEILDAYEVGAKTTLLDGRMRLNVSAFDYGFTDMQVRSINPINITRTLLRNAGEAEMQGLEVEMLVLPFESLQLDVGLAWLDAEFVDFAVPVSPSVPDGNHAGNKIPSSPEFTANIGIKYSKELAGWGSLVAQADYYYSDEQFFSELNDVGRADSYGLLNLRASIESADNTWKVSLFGKNVTDELVRDFTFVSGFLFGEGYLVSYTSPRTYGVDLTYQF